MSQVTYLAVTMPKHQRCTAGIVWDSDLVLLAMEPCCEARYVPYCAWITSAKTLLNSSHIDCPSPKSLTLNLTQALDIYRITVITDGMLLWRWEVAKQAHRGYIMSVLLIGTEQFQQQARTLNRQPQNTQTINHCSNENIIVQAKEQCFAFQLN